MATKSVRWAFNFKNWKPTPSDIILAASCVQPEEKERLSKFVFKKDFKSSLIGRLLMRKFVHEAIEIPYNEIVFARDERGKPILNYPVDKAYCKVNFNVSHQGDYCVLAGEIGDDLLGVDVMKMEYSGGKDVREFFRIMNKQFTEDEWTAIKSAGSDSEQISMFCRHWCLKESYVKAIGVGITINLRRIDFKINSDKLSKIKLVNDSELYVDGVKVNWSFEEMLLDDHHCVSVALDKGRMSNLLFSELSFSDIVEKAVPLSEFDEDYCENYYKKLD